MVTYFSKNDMRSFGQHVANWITQGMIQKNEKGFYPVTDEDISNWQVGLDVGFRLSSPPDYHIRSKCPKARKIVDELHKIGSNLFIDSDYELNFTTNIRMEARNEKVVIAYFCEDSNQIEIAGYIPETDVLTSRMQAYKAADGMRIKTDIPVWCFPIYNGGGVHESTGVVFHLDDL